MFDERFARQHRYGLPPDFRLASPYTSIVRHLSGPNLYARPQQSLNDAVGWWCTSWTSQPDPTDHFRFADKFKTHPLADKLDSLVRVTRREVQVC